jgi:hypothetical protein
MIDRIKNTCEIVKAQNNLKVIGVKSRNLNTKHLVLLY